MSASAPSIGLVGAGTLGGTVVRAALGAGSTVTVLVRGDELRARRRSAEIAGSVRRDVGRGRLSADDADDLLARLRCTARLEDLSRCEVVVESVPESAPLKHRVIAAIESVVDREALIASTTSSIPARVLAAGAIRPERVVVAHYVWPAHRIPLVEVAFHDAADPDAVRRLHELLAGQRKRALLVADRPGFFITRALFAYWDGVVALVRDGCSPARVDHALVASGWPMGPFAVMQATGLDSVARIAADLLPRLDRPLPSLGALVIAITAGACRGPDGRAAVEPWAAGLRRPDARVERGDDDIVARATYALAAEVDRAVREGVVRSWPEAAWAIEQAYGAPSGDGGLAQWWQGLRDGRRAVPAPREAAEDVLAGGREGRGT